MFDNRKEALLNHEKFYFTGKPCRRSGHVSKRYAANGKCFECGKDDSVRFESIDRLKKHVEEFKARDYKGYNERVNERRKKSAKGVFGRAGVMFRNARARAKKKGLEFTITQEWVKEKLSNGHCEVTKIQFNLDESETRMNPFAPSIDKKDPNGGYTESNCQVVITAYNLLKSQFDQDTINQVVKSLYRRENNVGLGLY
jgi:hypothetical protein